jgi:PAS domain S-box-containing protein
MELEIWGASSTPYITLPERPFGYLMIAIYIGLMLLAILQRRRDFSLLSRQQRGFTLLLALVSIIGSQLFLISISTESQLPPLSSAQNPEAYLAPFSFVAFIFAGATLNPLAALFVGFAGGLGRALWQTHQITDLFNYAFAGLVAAYLMQQNYSGRLYGWLRNPIAAGVSSSLILLPLIGLSTLAYANASASNLEALDLALSTSNANIVPLLAQGLLGGIVVNLLLIGLPQLRPKRREVPSPLSHSLNTRLVATFLLFAILLSFLLLVIGFNLAIRLSTDLVLDQMARDAQAVSSSIPNYRGQRQNLLVQTSLIDDLLSGDQEDSRQILEQLFKTGPYFRSLILVNESNEIIANYPEDQVSRSLTNVESIAVEDTLTSGAPFISSAQELEGVEYVLSYVVPVLDDRGEAQGALVGRVPDVSLEELVVALQGTLGQGLGFILDEQNQIIGHPESDNLMRHWEPPINGRREIGTGDGLPGTAFEGLQGSTNARQLIYYLPGPDHPWSVVITVPYEVILEQALRIASQLAIVLIGAMVLFGALLLWLGRSISSPLTELAHISQEIAGGSLDTPINPQGDDEIGRLGHAFGQMQLSLKRRLDELSLLLDVSQDVSKSIDINQGMPSVLKGALRGTGAAGARVVVMNPSGRKPLSFGEGPASSAMADYDRQVMHLIRQQKELVLASPTEVTSILKNGKAPESLPKALVALPLATKHRFQGIFWLSYRDVHQFDQTELSFLRTLSGQASVLVENARLFATAEGGRRRLAAVLSSTSDAVIVTDQTDRILLINPAMERFFDIKASEVIGRSIKDSVKSQELIEALTTDSERTYNVEIPVEEGLVLYASSSTIFNNDGQVLGRVAVLHDITYLKELDEMKSEFVATVSHDLRSPLTFMLGYATMMPMVGNLEPKQEEYLYKIVGGIEQMADLVDGLLDLGRLEAGVGLVFSRVRPRDILESVYQEYLQPARESGLNLVIQPDQDLPTIVGDAPLIRQAVANYVSNAIKYAPDSGEVFLKAIKEGNEVIFTVRDKGPGISTKDQVRLFEKFYRVKTRTNERTKGTGLGLALAKSIAERHSGRAWCESQAGQGSAFFISIPLEIQPQPNGSDQLI